MGWSGVCIEPSPKAFKRLKANYNGHKGIYLYNFAIGDHNGRVILHESGPLCNSHDIALVSTRHAHEMDRFKATVKYEPIEVKCFRWKTFLNRSRIKEFDFISLDAEGDDSMILEQIDLSKVKCVCVEWNSKDNLKTEFERMLREFKVIYTSAENLIFAR